MSTLDLEVLTQDRCVAIIRGSTTTHFASTAQTLFDEGLHVLELPLTTPGALAALRPIAEDLGDTAIVGVGTVTTLEEAQAAVAAGARFLVSPNLDLTVLAYAVGTGTPMLAGAFTPSEVLAAARGGATAVKLFPASVGGPGYVRQLRSPFPNIPLVPTGGVDIADAAAFLDAGAVALGMGSTLLGSAAEGGPQDDLRTSVQRFHHAVGRAE